jgi:hypothetical protein
MARTPQEIFEHHVTAIRAGDVDGIVSDYAEDAVLVTAQGAVRGRAAVREAFTGVLSQLSDATWDFPTQVYEDDVLFVVWSVVGEKARIMDGVDTLVFRDDAIRVQTAWFTLEPTP